MLHIKIRMKAKFKDIEKLFIDTPLLEIKYKYKNKIRIVYAKCEWYSLTGSIKDKVAYQIFFDAYTKGKLKDGDKIVEVSSGNMGISVCAVSNLLNLKTTILMPKTVSDERKKLIRLYGATLIETENFKEAFRLCKRYEKEGYFCPSQFSNISNVKVHYNITGNEILKLLGDLHVNAFVAGVGTSGTLMGVGKILKEKLKLKVIALEPKNAQILSNCPPFKTHKIQGLSDEILPKLYNKNLVDNIIQISDEDAISMAQKLCKELSLGVGISSGANFLGAILSGDKAITIFPDDNKKYLSTSLGQIVETELIKNIELLSFSVL